MAPSHHFHSLLTSPRLVTLLLSLFYTVPTAYSQNLAPKSLEEIKGHTPRLRGNFVSSPDTPSYDASTKSPAENHRMLYIVFGAIAGIIFLALCCYGAQMIFKAYRRRQVRAASHSINTRRASTDSIWGIPPEPHSAYPREDRPYDYSQHNQTSLGTTTISRGHSGTMEKELGFPVWRNGNTDSPSNWNQNEPSPAYHESGYTGIPPYDLEKGNNYSRESLPPIVPLKNNKAPKARDTTSAIIEDRYGPGVINRSEMRSSYESYRQAAPTVPVRPPSAPRSLPVPMPMI